ncbi:hypothetical protein GOP47_0026230 [Adiantum capillus-veneris]|nr:hypothetical protein GOP47_0026230 [Adiantum capillus-veneris]
MWRSQGRQPGPSDIVEDGQRSGHLNALDPLFSRRGGSPETGSESFELWLGLGSHRSDPAPSLFDRLQSFFGRRREGSGTRLGFGVGSHYSSGPRSLVDVRDFLLGPGGDLLIQHLMEGGEGGRNGSTPASKASVEAMPSLIISKPSLDADDVYCAVCKEVFDIGCEAREMPCKHIYHASCILPWLAVHNSCPICRHKMPSEVRIENQGREGLEIALAEGNMRTSGERGLAIVGIPGIGILVRSFLLLGNGAHNEGTVSNESSNIDEGMQTSSIVSDASSRQLEFGYGGGSVTSASCHNEIHPSVSETQAIDCGGLNKQERIDTNMILKLGLSKQVFQSSLKPVQMPSDVSQASR